MTTTVKISAHCAENIEVLVTIGKMNSAPETITMNDGETREFYVYGDRVLTVQECEKK